MRPTLARRLLSKDAELTAGAIVAELGGLAPGARRTITHDNGGGFARHETVATEVGQRAFFCDPHSPWRRGSIENAKRRLRRDLPRETSLGDYTDDDIDDGIWNLIQRLASASPTRHSSRHSPQTSVSLMKCQSSN